MGEGEGESDAGRRTRAIIISIGDSERSNLELLLQMIMAHRTEAEGRLAK
jgi:hypothetical protein